MARYTGAVCRQCRRENQKLFLKGDRCYSDKCALARRSFVPGQHGQNQARKKVSEYGLQLRAKQKAKRYYGVLRASSPITLKWPSANPASPVRICLGSLKADWTISSTARALR